MLARLNLCALEFMLAAAAKPREDYGGVELESRLPQNLCILNSPSTSEREIPIG